MPTQQQTAPDDFITAFLQFAESLLGVKEEGENRGAKVEEIQRSVGLQPGSSWCVASISYCLQQACEQAGVKDTNHIIDSCIAVGQLRDQAKKLDAYHKFDKNNDRLPEPGDVLILGMKKDWHGHAPIVKSVNPETGEIVCIGANSNGGVNLETYNINNKGPYERGTEKSGLYIRGFVSTPEVVAGLREVEAGLRTVDGIAISSMAIAERPAAQREQPPAERHMTIAERPAAQREQPHPMQLAAPSDKPHAAQREQPSGNITPHEAGIKELLKRAGEVLADMSPNQISAAEIAKIQEDPQMIKELTKMIEQCEKPGINAPAYCKAPTPAVREK